jgi:hypothetical protein
MAGKAEILGHLPEQAFPAAVVGGVARAALPLAKEAVDVLLAIGGLRGLVADQAERPAAPGMKKVDVGGSVGLVAPLATPLPQRLMGRGRCLLAAGRGMAGDTLFTLSAHRSRAESARETQSKEGDESARLSEVESHLFLRSGLRIFKHGFQQHQSPVEPRNEGSWRLEPTLVSI